jgi:hypothetical protein
MFYATIQAEILRICRATAQYTSYIEACDPFLKRMVRQGANKNDLKQPLQNMIFRHFKEFEKYNLQKEQLLKEILKYDVRTHAIPPIAI